MTSPSLGNLKEAFQLYVKSPLILVEPGGNYGDSLIYWGAEFLAQSIGLRYRRMVKREFLNYPLKSNEIVYIHGGGGYNRWCSGGVLECLKHAFDFSVEAIIQGPCTVDNDSDYMTNVMIPVFENRIEKENVVLFFAREKLSYRLSQKFLSPYCSNVILDQDTALWLTKEEIIKRTGVVKEAYRFYAFREDNESDEKIHRQEKRGVAFDPAYFCSSFNHWLKVHARAEKIITNRTHSSIVGAILGKDTTIFQSKYHKNRSIWEYSLERKGVKWSQGLNTIGDNRKVDWIDHLPKTLRQSYKVERLVRWLQRVPLQ